MYTFLIISCCLKERFATTFLQYKSFWTFIFVCILNLQISLYLPGTDKFEFSEQNPCKNHFKQQCLLHVFWRVYGMFFTKLNKRSFHKVLYQAKQACSLPRVSFLIFTELNKGSFYKVFYQGKQACILLRVYCCFLPS